MADLDEGQAHPPSPCGNRCGYSASGAGRCGGLPDRPAAVGGRGACAAWPWPAGGGDADGPERIVAGLYAEDDHRPAAWECQAGQFGVRRRRIRRGVRTLQWAGHPHQDMAPQITDETLLVSPEQPAAQREHELAEREAAGQPRAGPGGEANPRIPMAPPEPAACRAGVARSTPSATDATSAGCSRRSPAPRRPAWTWRSALRSP